MNIDNLIYLFVIYRSLKLSYYLSSVLSSEDDELDLSGIDDEEIDSYIMSEQEIRQKTKLWLKVSAGSAGVYKDLYNLIFFSTSIF